MQLVSTPREWNRPSNRVDNRVNAVLENDFDSIGIDQNTERVGYD